MEASDAFAQEITGDEDPFKGTDLDFDEPQEPQAPDPAGAAPPLVDREGERIDEAAPEAAPAPAESAPEAAADPTPPAESAGQTEDATPTAETTETAAPPPPPLEGAEPEPTTPSGGEDPPTPAGPEASAPAPTSSAAPTTGASAGPPSSDSGSAGESDEPVAPEPDETKDKSNRVVKRRYVIFRADGPGKLTQLQWYEAKGKLVERGTAGAKRQNVCVARDIDGALRFGYMVSGAPKHGVKLVAIAKLHYQPREVKPMPPEPSKQRLQIN